MGECLRLLGIIFILHWQELIMHTHMALYTSKGSHYVPAKSLTPVHMFVVCVCAGSVFMYSVLANLD